MQKVFKPNKCRKFLQRPQNATQLANDPNAPWTPNIQGVLFGSLADHYLKSPYTKIISMLVSRQSFLFLILTLLFHLPICFTVCRLQVRRAQDSVECFVWIMA